MINIQYFIHQLLNSKYILLINLFIAFCFYTFFYGTKYIYCMNENINTISSQINAEIKESIRPSHQVQAIMREIDNFAAQTKRIEEQTAIIDTLTEENDKLKRKMYEYIQQKDSVRESLANQRAFLNEQRMEIALEKSRVEKASRYIKYLEDRVRDLSIENALKNKQLNMQGLRGTSMEELEQRRLMLENDTLVFSVSSEDISQNIAEEKTRASVETQVSRELAEQKSKSILDGGYVRGRKVIYKTR